MGLILPERGYDYKGAAKKMPVWENLDISNLPIYCWKKCAVLIQLLFICNIIGSAVGKGRSK
jgi:hypothetical protein